MKYRLVFATLAMLMTSGAAQADECDIMAAKIAKSMHLVVDPKRARNFIGMTSEDDGTYGAQVNCDQDHLGLNLHVISLPDVPLPPDWYDVIADVISTLIDVRDADGKPFKIEPTIIRDYVQQCVSKASALEAKHQRAEADLVFAGAHMFCNIVDGRKSVELYKTETRTIYDTFKRLRMLEAK
jgi:hypothetical protein